MAKRFKICVRGLGRSTLDVRISRSPSSIACSTSEQGKYGSCSLNVTSIKVCVLRVNGSTYNLFVFMNSQ